MVKNSDDINYGFNIHPDIVEAAKLHREEAQGLSGDHSLGNALAIPAKLEHKIVSPVSDPIKSVNHRKGLPGGMEALPSVDPHSTNREENQKIWQMRINAANKINVVKRGIS